LAFLRTCLSAKDKLQALLSHLRLEELAAAVETISDSAGKINESKALLAAFVEKYLKIADLIPAAPTGPANCRNNNTDHRTGNAMIIFDAIYRDSRLVVAERVGRANLLSKPCGAVLPDRPDHSFAVSRGEHLVLLPAVKSETNKSTRIVCNRHGDVGELFQDLRLTPLQEVYSKSMPFSVFEYLLTDSDGGCATEGGRPTPLLPASESNKKVGGKRRRQDSWRPSF
jgi:hypothetical protein